MNYTPCGTPINRPYSHVAYSEEEARAAENWEACRLAIDRMLRDGKDNDVDAKLLRAFALCDRYGVTP